MLCPLKGLLKELSIGLIVNGHDDHVDHAILHQQAQGACSTEDGQPVQLPSPSGALVDVPKHVNTGMSGPQELPGDILPRCVHPNYHRLATKTWQIDDLSQKYTPDAQDWRCD